MRLLQQVIILGRFTSQKWHHSVHLFNCNMRIVDGSCGIADRGELEWRRRRRCARRRTAAWYRVDRSLFFFSDFEFVRTIDC